MAQLYNNFKELMEESVLPLIKKHPDWIRLDGQMAYGIMKHLIAVYNNSYN